MTLKEIRYNEFEPDCQPKLKIANDDIDDFRIVIIYKSKELRLYQIEF